MPRTVSRQSVEHARVNNMHVVQVPNGGSFSRAQVGHIFFLSRIEGTFSTIKDANGNTIMVLDASHEWQQGFRIDDGFTVDNGSGTDNDLEFFEVAVGAPADFTG